MIVTFFFLNNILHQGKTGDSLWIYLYTADLLKSKTLKSNFTEVKAVYFQTKAALCMTNFTTDKSKTGKLTFG